MTYKGRHVYQIPPAIKRVKAVKWWWGLLIALLLIPLFGCAIMIRQHGFDFFVFRQAGTGETSGNGLTENQGPGQPDAPKPTVETTCQALILGQPTQSRTCTFVVQP